MLSIGDAAPDFELQDLAGIQKHLSDFVATKPAVVAFFKVTCPVCQLTFPYLERMSKSDNLEFVGVSQDDVDRTEEFRRELGITFPTLLDDPRMGYVASNRFDISNVPSIFLIEPDRGISMAFSGFSKRDLEQIGKLAGIAPFEPNDRVPDFKAG
jgi:peroxiredoxin